MKTPTDARQFSTVPALARNAPLLTAAEEQRLAEALAALDPDDRARAMLWCEQARASARMLDAVLAGELDVTITTGGHLALREPDSHAR